MTGPSASSGSAVTGDWVTDGMVFVLTDSSGNQFASVTAVVQCTPFGEVLPSALATAPYFPLQVGDEWLYLYNSRIGNGRLPAAANYRSSGDRRHGVVCDGRVRKRIDNAF